MFLIHARFRNARAGAPPPEGLTTLLTVSARPDEGLEHAVLHEIDGGRDLVVGLFLVAGSLAQAEQVAAEVVARALSTCSELADIALVECGAVLPLPAFESLAAREPREPE